MKTLRAFPGIAAIIALGFSSIEAADLAAGGYHAVRVDGGSVKGLGDGTYGQLGPHPIGAPASVAGLGDVTAVAAGGFTTLALKSDGTVWFFGETTLQHPTPHGTPNPVSTPVQVPGLGGIDSIAAGHRHYLALDADTGNLYGWGHNGSGQVGDGGLLDVTNPVLVLTGVSSMSAGDGFSLAVKRDGTLWTWGTNRHGQLGLGDTADRHGPTQVAGIGPAAKAAAGGRHALILLADGSVLATGDNEFGQLGLGTTNSTTTPTVIPGPSGVTQLAVGYFHSAALGSTGEIWVWGRNFEGQCGGGNASPVTHPSPQSLAGLHGTPTAIACGYHFTLIRLADGSIVGTGSNSDGQIDGSSVATQDDSRHVLIPQLTPLSPDLTAPQPNPMSFSSPPAALNATSISMTASEANDPSTPVEYFFQCTTSGGNDSGWQIDKTYIDTGLVTGVPFIYQVKARDAAGNETAFSAPASAIPEEDTTPPAIHSLDPVNGAVGIPTGVNLVLTFDEAVQIGSGSVVIKENWGNAVVATIDAAHVTISDTQVTVEPPATLASGTQYYVELTAGAITDLSGNPFGGIAGSKTWSFVTAVTTPPAPSLLAHYTFDVASGGTTPDSVGSAFATLGGGVGIDPNIAGKIGAGALRMTNANGSNAASVDGAVTSNSFAWANGARTVTFWWKAMTPVADTGQGTYVSFGTTASNGTRFDIKETNSASPGSQLRVEIQGVGFNTNPANFDDGNWHFVAVTVPDNATFREISWYVDGSATSLNTSLSTLAIATGTGPVVFGDSIITAPNGGDNRTPNGFLDDFQLYGRVLTQHEILFLRDNPGDVLGMPTATFDNYMSDPTFGIDPTQQGFADDPDRDGLANGLEAWFGTHPAQPNTALSILASDGTTTTFSHPQNESPPADIIGFYEWSPDLDKWYAGDGVDAPPGGPTVVFSVESLGATTVVTATASAASERLFMRAVVRRN